MTRRGFAFGRQLGVFAAVAALALSLSGDRTSAAGVPATVYGQDPLEVLELKVRPNVLVVLDTSGSMSEVADTSNPQTRTGGGDNPRSKMFQAKAVLKNLIQQNQSRVSFQFLSYTQVGSTFLNQEARTTLTGNQSLRFRYQTQTAAAANLKVLGAYGDTLGRGLQSWQIIRPEWNRLYFGESSPSVTCYVTVPGTPRFFYRGSDLATLLQGLMNGTAPNPAPTCTGTRANTYQVTYNGGSGTFNFARASGSKNFNIRWADTPYNIRGALGLRAAGNTGLGTTQVTSGTPYILLYRNNSGNLQGPEYNDYVPFQYTDLGISTTFYQMGAGRWFNGEVVRVQSDGSVCGMTFPTTTQTTNPPQLTLQLVATGCGADTANQSAVFTWAGSAFGNNTRSCRGGMSKVPLIPCDLPTAGTIQYTNVFPFLEPMIPLDNPGGLIGNGFPRGYTEYQDGSWQTQTFQVAPSLKSDGSTPIANALIDIKGLADTSNSCLVVSGSNPVEPCSDPTKQTCVVGTCAERNFAKIWNTGQKAATGPPETFPLDAIKNHLNPKEKTIVVFVTDGEDTCLGRGADTGSGSGDANALRAAYYAERLNTPLVAGETASAVETYMIGYGGAFAGTTPTRLNWIAWGGSGLGLGQPGQPDIATTGTNCESWGNGTTGNTGGTKTTLTGTGQTGTCQWSALANLTAQKALCTTCRDAIVAPDAATLATKLQAIIDQGASDGEFNAQQSIAESVYEDVDRVAGHDARMPTKRYQGLVPTRFVSSFSLPGFKGQLRAYQNDGHENSVQVWSAGDKLWQKVSAGMSPTSSTTPGCPANATANVGAGECVLAQLHGGATDTTIANSAVARIKRRIYTTNRNGVYTFSPATLIAGTAPERVSLWPPQSGLLPTDYSSCATLPGSATNCSFDSALGLPPNAPTAFPPDSSDPLCNASKPDTPKKSYDTCWFEALKKDFKVCLGSILPTACPASTVTTFTNAHMRAARREARDIIVAFLAGAATVPDGVGIKRTSAAYQSAPASSILFKAQDWVLADSELATVAVVTPPSLSEPEATPYVAEYRLYRDGVGSQPRADSDLQVRQGFGLARPDNDASGNAIDTRTHLKPVMTVVYAPANDMLHAFRAAPNCSPAFTQYDPFTGASACAETGGEELWGFVPYDQLEAVRLRAAKQPQGRDNHVFMLTRGVRFADVFVPGTLTDPTIGGVTAPSMQGVWRHVLYFGRGIGGKYVTALDVTAPGPYTTKALDTVGPIPLWNRGNPDTENGLTGGTPNNTLAPTDLGNYAHMGETWSMPTVAYVNKYKTNPLYVTARRPDGVDFVIFMGSGYGNPSAAVREGTTHYTLDALSGDIVAAVDVEDAAATHGLTRSTCGVDPATGTAIETSTCSVMKNAIVANSVSFNWASFASISAKVFNQNPHPWSYETTRVYVGDLHGRLWKFLTAYPDVAVPAADFGANQPIATAVALLGEKVFPNGSEVGIQVPNIFVTSGAERRASGPFRVFSLRDDGTDDAATFTGTTAADGVTTFQPVVLQFGRTFDQGSAEANCGYPTEAVFRGTIQPTSTVECDAPLVGGTCEGNLLQRVFFGGTRLSLPNTKYAPPTPLACGGTGQYPCRSQFDSILYALGVKSGGAAYTMGGDDDAYRIFRDSRIAALSWQADPETATGESKGSRFVADEGLMKGTPKAPPPPGKPPTATTATANVVFQRESGQPAPSVHYGSTVCQ